MRELIFLTCLLLLFPALALAQDAPKVEVFGGYSYLRADDEDDGTDLHGWNASVTGNFNKWFGVTADFSGHYGDFTFIPATATTPGLRADLNTHLFLTGPKFAYRGSETFTPYAHVLLGAARIGASARTAAGRFSNSDTSFAFAAGGGLDIKLHKNLAVRVVQADYVLTTFDENLRDATGAPLIDPATGRFFCGLSGFAGKTQASCDDRQHNLRLSTGLVLRLGN